MVSPQQSLQTLQEKANLRLVYHPKVAQLSSKSRYFFLQELLFVCFWLYFSWLSGPSCSSAAQQPRAEQCVGGARCW